MGTRFRAYQLGEPGSSFSYCHDGHFTLIEARITEQSIKSLTSEIARYGNGKVDCLHITSWDRDHCDPDSLAFILAQFNVGLVEAPGYPPTDSDAAQRCFRTLLGYKSRVTLVARTPQQLGTLEHERETDAKDVYLWPFTTGNCSNDNSTAKIFRRGHFTLLSLGDLESKEIAVAIAASPAARQADVMLLAHHGADNGVTSKEFLSAIKPRVAISTSDYDNQFEHPKQEIRDLLFEYGIDLYTTKTGDVLIESVAENPRLYRLTNYMANNEEVSKTWIYGVKSALVPAA